MAFATPGSRFDLGEITVVMNWGHNMTNQDKVQSVISFSEAKNGEAQWGDDIDPDSIIMLNTKLELDVQDTKSDELELTLQALDGMANLDFHAVREAGGYAALLMSSLKSSDHSTAIQTSLGKVLKILLQNI